MAKRRKQKRGKASRSPASPKSGMGLMVGVVAVGVIVLAGAYFLILANTQTPAPAAHVAQVEQPQQVVEEASAASAAENSQQTVVEDISSDLPVAPAVGALAPDFTLADTAGTQVSLADFRGKPAVVTFFHTW